MEKHMTFNAIARTTQVVFLVMAVLGAVAWAYFSFGNTGMEHRASQVMGLTMFFGVSSVLLQVLIENKRIKEENKTLKGR
jgi:O-antigen/teichoic acid export membrane protein